MLPLGGQGWWWQWQWQWHGGGIGKGGGGGGGVGVVVGIGRCRIPCGAILGGLLGATGRVVSSPLYVGRNERRLSLLGLRWCQVADTSAQAARSRPRVKVGGVVVLSLLGRRYWCPRAKLGGRAAALAALTTLGSC